MSGRSGAAVVYLLVFLSAFGTAASAPGGYSDRSVALKPWCGLDDVDTVDIYDYFGDNLSGLYLEPPHSGSTAILWAVENYPSTLYRLLWNGSYWLPEQQRNWANGKAMHYADGTGSPDAEDITKAGPYSNLIYVSTERNDHDNLPMNMVLLFELQYNDTNTSLNATRQWNLTSDLPQVSDSNKGIEALTWVPDEYLVANHFMNESGYVYDPSNYPNHGDGLILVGLEDNGVVYAYALDHETEEYARVASFSSEFPAIMALSFDATNGYLWCVCDDNCDGVHHVFSIIAGEFALIAAFERPETMGGNYNTEGFTVAADSVCDEHGYKPVLWSDDTQDAGHAIRYDRIPCGAFIEETAEGSSAIDPEADLLVPVIVGVLICLAVAFAITYILNYRNPRAGKAGPVERDNAKEIDLVKYMTDNNNPMSSSAVQQQSAENNGCPAVKVA